MDLPHSNPWPIIRPTISTIIWFPSFTYDSCKQASFIMNNYHNTMPPPTLGSKWDQNWTGFEMVWSQNVSQSLHLINHTVNLTYFLPSICFLLISLEQDIMVSVPDYIITLLKLCYNLFQHKYLNLFWNSQCFKWFQIMWILESSTACFEDRGISVLNLVISFNSHDFSVSMKMFISH